MSSGAFLSGKERDHGLGNVGHVRDDTLAWLDAIGFQEVGNRRHLRLDRVSGEILCPLLANRAIILESEAERIEAGMA